IPDYLTLLGAVGAILSVAGYIAGYIRFRSRPSPKPLSPKSVTRRPTLRDPLTYWILGVNLLVTLLLPLQLIAEFPVKPGEHNRYADYIFYFRHYPHITVYPA